jgi:mRNA-degrading endonuclease toxin of MazEF toxin-antitoxin module
MNYDKGDIVIVKFPFIIRRLEIEKGRPALVISGVDVQRRYNDYTLAAITSQIPDDLMALEIILEPTKPNGLLKKSLLRLDFVMTIPVELISRKIGVISQDKLKEAENKLRLLFKL